MDAAVVVLEELGGIPRAPLLEECLLRRTGSSPDEGGSLLEQRPERTGRWRSLLADRGFDVCETPVTASATSQADRRMEVRHVDPLAVDDELRPLPGDRRDIHRQVLHVLCHEGETIARRRGMDPGRAT